MAHWYQPKEKFKEWREHRKDPDCLGVFRKRPRDKFYRVWFIDATVLRPKERYVVLPFGVPGKTQARFDDEGRLIDPRDQTTEVADMVTDFPYGGIKKGLWGTNFHFRFAPLKLVHLARVFTGQRVERFAEHDVTTADPFTLPEVDAIISYRVVNPLRALTVPETGDFKKYVKEFGGARLTDVVNNNTLDNLMMAKGRKSNYSWTASGIPQPRELNDAGLVIDTIQLSELKLPEDIKGIVNARAEAEYRAQATIRTAEAVSESSDHFAHAGNVFENNEGARAAFMADMAAKSERINYDEAAVIKSRAFAKIADTFGRLVEKVF